MKLNEEYIIRASHIISINDELHKVQINDEILGMKLLRQKDYPGGRFTLAFVGYGDEKDNTVEELTHNWDDTQYDLGNAFGHLAFGVEDIYATCEQMRQNGATICREPGPMKHGNTVIAFVEDPDGYKIELIER